MCFTIFLSLHASTECTINSSIHAGAGALWADTHGSGAPSGHLCTTTHALISFLHKRRVTEKRGRLGGTPSNAAKVHNAAVVCTYVSQRLQLQI